MRSTFFFLLVFNIIFVFCVKASDISTLVNANLATKLPFGSELALTIYDTQSKKNLIEINSNKLLPPASTQKLVTALAARLYLGEDFQFRTQVWQENQDLMFKFGGDPTLMRKDIKRLIQRIKQKNPSRTFRHVWLDEGIFTGYDNAVGLPWDILGICYSAPATALTIEKNCVQASIYTNTKTGSTQVFVPKHQPIRLSTDAITVTKTEQAKRLCDLELTYNKSNQYHLSGCLVERNKPLPLKLAIQDTRLYFKHILLDEFNKAGLSMTGEFKSGSLSEKAHLLAEHKSIKRDILLEKMLKESDNLISDNLLKYIGHLYYQGAGSFNNGAEAVKKIILEKTGIDLSHSVLADGAGLSRNNRLTVNQLMSLLKWLHQHDKPFLHTLLPTSGIDGTLKYRRGLQTPLLKGKIQAKTGSLFGTHNLAGIVNTAKKNELLVVQFVANYHVIPVSLQQKAPQPIIQFEKALYTHLVSAY